MTTGPTQKAPQSMYRDGEGLGVWEHRGKVAAVGIGHSPTARRWDGLAENSVGANTILAIQKAMEDAGVSPDQVDGLVLDADTTTGAHWQKGDPVPMDVVNAFNPTDDPLDGIAKLSAEWVIKNVPGLQNIKFTAYANHSCMSDCVVVAAQAVGDGLCNNCLVVKGWHNLAGRYYQGGAAAEDTLSGRGQFNLWGAPASYGTASQFAEYCIKYGKNHDMMAPFVVNSKRNGLLFPEGFFAQHRPDVITVEDYISARWIAKPANLFDNDIPIMASAAYLFTTAERAKDMKQKPVYILNHTRTWPRIRGVAPTLDDIEAAGDIMGRQLYEGAGITANDVSFQNMYDGFTLFHLFHLEGLRYRGVQRGEGLDFFQGDISIEGPNPVSPSGGNTGSGRTRFWMHTDSIQQIQGRAGARAITGVKPEIAISGGTMPQNVEATVWSATPD